MLAIAVQPADNFRVLLSDCLTARHTPPMRGMCGPSTYEDPRRFPSRLVLVILVADHTLAMAWLMSTPGARFVIRSDACAVAGDIRQADIKRAKNEDK